MRRCFVAVVLSASLFTMSPLAWADEYDRMQAGNPWQIIAYIIYPVGVVLDKYVARPLHNLMHQEKYLDEYTGHSELTKERDSMSPTGHGGHSF